MGLGPVEYTALARRWGDGWEIYVLDNREGLLGVVVAGAAALIEAEVRTYLSRRYHRARGAFSVSVIYR